MKVQSIYYTLLITLLLITCKKDAFETINRSYGKGYANISIGSYNIYKVEEIIYDDFFNTIDTNRYQLKELNESKFVDNLNRSAVRIERYKLNSKNQWAIMNVWYAVENNSAFERIEENKRFIKLSFPVSDEVIWNSNLYNSDNSNYVYYDFINKPYKLDTLPTFDSAVSVKSDPVISSIRQRQYNEVYAKNIGLVYKYIVSVDKNGVLQRGFKYKQQLIKHVP